jgi:hypothetical protein
MNKRWRALAGLIVFITSLEAEPDWLNRERGRSFTNPS